MQNIIKKLEKIFHIRIKKMHLDYVAGILSIPVLLTAIIINFGNLNRSQTQTITASPTPQVIIVPKEEKTSNKATVVEETPFICKKEIGPVTIKYPAEGEKISDNPVCIEINYSDESYCSVVWSYKINDSAWSEYNNNSPCLYDVPKGEVSFKLRVNSTVSSETKSINRNFTYEGANNPTSAPSESPTPIASPSGSL